MTILGISGSLRAASTNTLLLRALLSLAPEGIHIRLYEDLDSLPHFSPERDTEPAPASVSHLRGLLREADAVVICTPEYIHGMPGVLKNMLDWLASSGEFVHKPVGVISASPSDMGGSRAHASLYHTLDVLTAHLSSATSLIVPFVRTKLDAHGNSVDPLLSQQLQDVVNSLTQAIHTQPII